MENGESVMMCCPLRPRKAKASQTSATKPTTRRTQVRYRQKTALPDGAISQKASTALRYISATHSVEDQPIAFELGDSFTIRMPKKSKARVRVATCRSTFQTGSPLDNREPRAKGIDIPTMKRKAGKTRS